MASKRGNFNMKKVPLRCFSLRSLSTASKISLKEKLTVELALVRSTIDKIGPVIPRTEQCCKSASNNTTRFSSTNQQQVPANRKRKSSEITQVLKKVKNANKNLSEVATNIDSKNSIGALRKKHYSDSNGFVESLCEKPISPTNEEQIRIEAQIKAAADQKAKSELIMKIKKEREASRLALEKMEATVEMNDYNQVMKELKGLGCQNISFYVLRQLGLFLKDDDYDDQKPAKISALTNNEIEEGEIII